MKFLDQIASPEDIKSMSIDELEVLASEVRDFLLQSIAVTGGHLSSNLGAVELTIALHYVFDSPHDQLIWDVGHQAYVHKLLTGRKEGFASLRMLDGMSGFLKAEESEHDIFEAGHSSTSISAAIGLAKAKRLKKDPSTVIPIIGDGALTGGMAFEALNYLGHSDEKVMIILNDNEMSISENVGGITKLLTRLRTFSLYQRVKRKLKQRLTKTRPGRSLLGRMEQFRESIKHLFIQQMFFEDLGIKYLGPVDGHDLEELMYYLEQGKKIDGPVLVHVITKKGKGYPLAEENPDAYHGVGSFDLEKGISSEKKSSFSSVFGDVLSDLAKDHQDLVAITAAMPSGTGLTDFQKAYPDRFIDVGIAEQNAVTMAAGLARNGFKPYVAIYSTFMQRAFDQMIHDVCLQKLSVTFCLDRSGLVGKDGETHQGVLDYPYLKLMPHMTIWAPKDTLELERMLRASISFEGPLAIKYPRASSYVLNDDQTPIDQVEVLGQGQRTIITYGRLVKEALEAAKELGNTKVVNMRVLKPLNKQALDDIIQGNTSVYIFEEGSTAGGLGESLQYLFPGQRLHYHGLPDQFIEHGEVGELCDRYGLTANGMLNFIKEKENAS